MEKLDFTPFYVYTEGSLFYKKLEIKKLYPKLKILNHAERQL